MIFSIQGELTIAFYLMIAAAVCDFFDGFAARLLKAFSPIGKDLDSLADMVSFGLLPAIMMHQRMVEDNETGFLSFVPLIIVVFSAIRLAKFNIDNRQTENFLGLPTPACAMLCGSLIFAGDRGINSAAEICHSPYLIAAVSVVLAILLIVEIPMLSIKFKKGSKDNAARLTLIAICVVFAGLTLILKIHWSFIPLLIFSLYIVHNIIRYIVSLFSKKK